ncbi:unnamed protein product [Didymodactylos carnosus]|uniref:EGF-like domain-containing protein n=1 Tax=Didymodactylos carnosus TaxID=1234261 RepID=A0A814WRJ0_9BILA|nr:unnamed protein product [Didymodactylos carnosus]CAF1371742.1 unnamed protein product [Didymodactylos carnosus]CAF3966330.1 unnamed protein product [Didymodactylos carnosus]CAF4180811.1 unnamed protein product [Didymodactylos carnosus]
MCKCAPGFTGHNCDRLLNVCADGSKCENNGTCLQTGPGTHRCLCTTNWNGTVCTDDVDECQPLPSQTCLHGGTCSNTIGSFHCHCVSGWGGMICDTHIDVCNGGALTCQNNGTCYDQGGGIFVCHCTPLTTGPNCDVDVDECTTPSVCKNGATCFNLWGNFICTCAPGWQGRTCEQDIDECALGSYTCGINADCLNLNGTWTCVCSQYYIGNPFVNCTVFDYCTPNPCEIQSLLHPWGNRTTCLIVGPGSYNCSCKHPTAELSIYVQNLCVDIDECATDTHFCNKTKSRCVNTDPHYDCECLPGFFDNITNVVYPITLPVHYPIVDRCFDLDECKYPQNYSCPINSLCINLWGSYTCPCIDDFFLYQNSCVPVNPCTWAYCTMYSHCVELLDYNYVCKCDNGFQVLSGQCVDIDECSMRKRCTIPGMLCVNTLGGYQCECAINQTCSFQAQSKFQKNAVWGLAGLGGLFIVIAVVSIILSWEKLNCGKTRRQPSQKTSYEDMLTNDRSMTDVSLTYYGGS